MDPSSSSSSSPPPAHREELLQNAVLFLRDPKVVNSSFTSKVQFLEGKGLSEEEIQEALRRSSSASSLSTSPSSSAGVLGARPDPREYGYMYAVRPEPPRRDWRDLFIMAVVSGGVIYGLTTLAKKYLMPHLQPPSSTAFQTTSSELTAHYDEAALLLSELQSQTSALQSALDADRERMNTAVEEVEQVTLSVRQGEERWREEMREIREEVESVRELMPREMERHGDGDGGEDAGEDALTPQLIEKHASSQSASLTELQSELRSLKTLLSSRQAAVAPPNGTTTPNGAGGAGGMSETTKAANALLGKGAKGIPAWQLSGSSSSSVAGSKEGSDTESAERT